MYRRVLSSSKQVLRVQTNYSTINRSYSSKSDNRKRGKWLWWTLVGATATGVALYAVSRPKKSKLVIPDNEKKTLVVLGSGWGALNFIKGLEPHLFKEVIVVSPTNYFLFTPLLPSAVVGTLNPLSIVEPLRAHIGGTNVKFYEAVCTSIDTQNNTITCEDSSALKPNDPQFSLNYDYLVMSIGSGTNTFNTPGVEENCFFVKQITDAAKLKNHILDCFETASLPHLSEEERRKFLHFVVVGGGPTGVEFAAELQDFILEDLKHYYGAVMPYVKVTLVHSNDHLLNTYSAEISQMTDNTFLRQGINTLFSARVTKVTPESVSVFDKSAGQTIEYPSATCVWATGISQTPLATQLSSSLAEYQKNHRALTTNEHLRVLGTNNVFALGDCATVDQRKLYSTWTSLFEKADKDGNGLLTLEEFHSFAKSVSKEYPQMKVIFPRLEAIFQEHDKDQSGELSTKEFSALLAAVDKELTAFPATAQVASQQGKYVAQLFNHHLAKENSLDNAKPFKYNHMGSFAYVGGNVAVLDLESIKLGGFVAWIMWRGAYLNQQFSVRSMISIAYDWCSTHVLGRDTSRF